MYKNAKYYIIGISVSIIIFLCLVIGFHLPKNEPLAVVDSKSNAPILRKGVYLIDKVVIQEGVKDLSLQAQSQIQQLLKQPKSVVWIADEQDFIKNKEQALHEHGYQASIKIKKEKAGRITLVVNIEVAPIYLRHIAFRGIPNKEKKKLQTLFTIQKGAPILAHHVAQIQQEIEDYLCKEGYADAQVVSSTTPEKLADGVFSFDIQRGIQYYLYSCIYEGINRADIHKLRKRSNLRPKQGPLNNYFLVAYRYLWGPEVFVEQKIQQHRQLFLAYYKSKGFLDSTITYRYKKRGNKVFLIFEIEKKAQYKISKVHIQGIQSYSIDKIKSVLDLKEGQPFFENLLSHKLLGKMPKHDIFKLYENRGKWLLVKDGHIEKLPNHEVEVNISFSEHPLPRIAGIVIQTDLKRDLLHNILHCHHLKKGALLKKSNLTACSNELKTLSFVKSDSLVLNPIFISQGEVIIQAEIFSDKGVLQLFGQFSTLSKENKLPEARFGIDYNNFDFMALCRGKKPTGRGQNISFSASANKLSFSDNPCAFNLLIENPYLFIRETPFTLHAEGIYKPSFVNKKTSTKWVGGIGRRFNTGMTRYHFGGNLTSLHQEIIAVSPKSLSTNLYWNIDSTNDYFFPTEGFKTSSKMTFSFKKEGWTSLPSFNYANATVSGSYFILLKNKWVCKLNAQIGGGHYKKADKLGYFCVGSPSEQTDAYIDHHSIFIRSNSEVKAPFFGVGAIDLRKHYKKDAYIFCFLNGGGGVDLLHGGSSTGQYVGNIGVGVVALLTSFGPIEIAEGYDFKAGTTFVKFGIKVEI